MCVKFHDEENRLEIIGGASCLLSNKRRKVFCCRKGEFENEEK